ncbi:MAG: RNA polymerase sigma factor [Myxococcales bacterium]|nr:RNA polymerase sigma factor [Myxococcales bacterium]MCB9712361.1 RNA polymerase sigma factor [Myxococcales bacterium]
MDDEQELLEAWRRGDRDAGSRLIALRSREVTWFFRNKVFHEDDVPDLVSQTFLRAVTARDRFEGRTSFRRFLYAIAHNVLREYLRARSKRQREALDFAQACVRELEPRSLSSLHSEKRQVQALIEALREVPIDDQVVLELKYFEGLTGRELAELLDVPEGTVRGRLARGLERLRERVREQLRAEASSVSVTDIESWAAELRRLRGAEG